MSAASCTVEGREQWIRAGERVVPRASSSVQAHSTVHPRVASSAPSPARVARWATGGRQMPDPRCTAVMPHASSDVRAHVCGRAWLPLRAVGQLVVPPAAIVTLDVDEPFVSRSAAAVKAATSRAMVVSTWFHGSQCRPVPGDHSRCRPARGDPLGSFPRSLRRRSRLRGQAAAA